jgi:signal transduction histidine kinase
MKSLRLMILLFALAVTACLGFLMLHAYRSLEAEETATLGYFAEALFDEMEAAAAALVRREEARPVDAYAASPEAGPDELRELPAEGFIRGYFQNNPDGSLQTPHQAPGPLSPAELATRLAELADANRQFNGLRAEGTDRLRPQPVEEPREERRKDQERFAEKYLDSTRSRPAKSYLGERDSRYEKVTPEQAYNLARPGTRSSAELRTSADAAAEEKIEERAPAAQRSRVHAYSARGSAVVGHAAAVQAEVAPFQSVFLDSRRVFTFRRVVIDGRMYRQGFVLRIEEFLAHLTLTHFTGQPLARFAHLRLRAVDQGVDAVVVDAGPPADRPLLVRTRTFPSPFGFLRATLASDAVPPAPGRNPLSLALAALAVVILGGLCAIYHSSRRIVDYSERRARFVSSVTHELKTPLTNIRMYIEMLEQGMAPDPEREQAYFRILHSESARLSRLIDNVLELSRLERSRRRPTLASGTFDEVLDEVAALTEESLRQEGFTLERENRLQRPFRYDREIMVQVLLNLIENSLKFGRSAAVKRIAIRVAEAGERVRVEVADSGPGIPHRDLRQVFEDFYRAENAVTAAVGGTGIGLAMVRRFVQLLGGTVSAANNDGPGCTIRIDLPRA